MNFPNALRLAGKVSPKLTATASLIFNPNSYLASTGWLRSYKLGRPSDDFGEPVPWMNYTVVNLLSERLNKTISVFEYGSGYSTIFYSNKARKVVSVEYDKNWESRVREDTKNLDNTRIIFRPLDKKPLYCETILEESQKDNFDVIVIDGRDRVNCLMHSISIAKEDTVILFDDTHRSRYANAFQIAKENSFKALRLSGLKPNGARMVETTIFYKHKNVLDL